MTINKSKDVIQKKVVLRQATEIEKLKDQIKELEIDCQEKENIINSIDVIRTELDSVITDLKAKRNEYDKLITELSKMRNVMNQTVFKGRWKLIKLLLK